MTTDNRLITSPDKMLQRTRSQEMVDDHHNHIVDEDPLLISQSLTYVTDDGGVLHSFRYSPFAKGKGLFLPDDIIARYSMGRFLKSLMVSIFCFVQNL